MVAINRKLEEKWLPQGVLELLLEASRRGIRERERQQKLVVKPTYVGKGLRRVPENMIYRFEPEYHR